MKRKHYREPKKPAIDNGHYFHPPPMAPKNHRWKYDPYTGRFAWMPVDQRVNPPILTLAAK